MEPTQRNDVSQLRDLNFDLVNYFANTIIPQLFVDAEMILRIFTPPAMKQFSLTHKDINRDFHEVKDNIRYPTIIENIKEVMTTNEILEKEVQTQDGNWFQMNILPYREHKSNTLNGVIITFVDITKRLETVRELEQLNSRHDVLMFALSHDLRQPLTSIVLISDGLKQAFKAGDTKQFQYWLKSLKTSTGNITSLIDGFTEDAKDSPDPEQSISRVNTEEVTRNVLEALRNEIEKNGVEIITSFKTSEILFPKNNLRSIVYNLIHNAIKFRRIGEPLILKIETYKKDDHVILSLEDNGIGIAPQDQETIFKKEKRVSNEIDGTGMGLYIIRRMLYVHEGRIEVASKPGEGSIFTVYFKSIPH